MYVIFIGGNISKFEVMNIDMKEIILSYSELIFKMKIVDGDVCFF